MIERWGREGTEKERLDNQSCEIESEMRYEREREILIVPNA